MTYVTGEEAAALTGRTIAVVDRAAATGVVPAKYVGWQLLVDPSEFIPEPGGVDEVQHIAITGGPNGGNFTLALDGQPTLGIPYHPSASQLQNAIANLPNVGLGNVLVTKPGSWDYDAEFVDALGATNLSQLVPDYSALKPTGTTAVTVTTTTQGSAGAKKAAPAKRAPRKKAPRKKAPDR